nr:MAG TPA: hypothetical protein [Caudoviricetes sp.]
MVVVIFLDIQSHPYNTLHHEIHPYTWQMDI